MKPQVEIYDTTLRDGSQGEGINFSVADKLRIAEKLDAFGVHYIEGGWPGSNPKDIEFFAQAKTTQIQECAARRLRLDAQKGRARRAGRPGAPAHRGRNARRHDLRQDLHAARQGSPALHAGGKSRDDRRHRALPERPRQIRHLRRRTCFDGYKLDPEYALATWQAAEKAGADFVVLCDTNGGCLPDEIAAITKVALGKLNCKVGIHTHDDIGLGVANALAALDAGAVHVQGTINGYGERTGNCNLTSVIPCIALKLKKTCVPAKSLPKLKELSQFVDEIANMRHNPRLPWVGSAAFAHKGGTHVNAVQKLAAQLRAH